MSKLVILRGIPGSGKSTYAKKLMKYYQDAGKLVAHYEADMFFTHDDGSYHWDPNKVHIAHQWCQRHVSDALDNCDVVIVANTNIKNSDVRDYIKIAEEKNATYEIIRMETRYTTIHSVPEETMQKMTEKFQDFPGEIIIKG